MFMRPTSTRSRRDRQGPRAVQTCAPARSKNRQAQEKISALHSNKVITEKKAEPVEEGASKPARSVIPLFAGLTPEEFEDFTKMMVVHTLPTGTAIVKQGDTGKSVYIIASGSVKVHTVLPTGERLDLARLGPSDFFGEMAFLTSKPRSPLLRQPRTPSFSR